MEIAECGIAFPLPKTDSLGRKILVLRLTRWDTQKHDFNDFVKYLTIVCDLIWEDQRTHAHGVSLLLLNEIKLLSFCFDYKLDCSLI